MSGMAILMTYPIQFKRWDPVIVINREICEIVNATILVEYKVNLEDMEK